MSGDVQPRKRKDKKRKKDDLGLEEPRGTSATLGEGDVFMHSHHEQGTGGHWCAKIIFFSLLAVLITLIGLIILENRGLSELEANAVESRYSGVLEGWLEDAPDDDHHDEHTLELSHHDDEHDDEDDDSEDEDVEVEKLEKEEPDEDPISTELPALPEDEDNNDDIDDDRSAGDLTDEEPDQDEYDKADEKDDYLEIDDNDEPMVEHITAPPGKPLPEVEEETSSEKPPNTLAEEEEYEKRQEELRREEEQSSHMWLKLTVGGALLAATHAVMRRATQPRDLPDDEEPVTGEDTPLIDRRLTLIPEEQPIYVPVKSSKVGAPEPSFGKVIGTAALLVKPPLVKKEESDEEEKYSDEEETQETAVSTEDNKELYSDDEEEAEEDDPIVEEPKQISKHSAPAVEKQPALNPEPEEEDIEEDDVEIIEDEQLDEELVDEEDEEEISDVDDAELLTRLEAKYGKLPEPERFGPKQYKDGGNSLVDDDWPGEPSDAYWRDQLDSAEREMLQDWLD